MNNALVKIICSIPVVLIALYFLPFLGICLLIFRYFVYTGNYKYNTPKYFIIIGIIILIPKVINDILIILKLNIKNIPYLNQIVSSTLYTKFIGYSKLLLTLGIIFLIISFIGSKIGNKLGNEIRNYIAEEQRKDAEISAKNDLKIKEKQERAKNTHVVHCPYCGSDNILTEKTGICKFCRRHIEYKG